MKSTRVNRIFFLVLSLSIAIGMVAASRETVLADTDPTSGLTYTIADGVATITGFTVPTGFAGILTIPDTLGGASVTSIGDNAFYYCESLTGITIPSSVTSIEDNAFTHCSSLSGITIPSSVKSIGSQAFGSCSNLTSITILNGLETIGSWAFHYCSGLASITIPSSVTSIGTEAFGYCNSLSSITLEAPNNTYKSLEGILYSEDGTALICCPGGKSGSITIPSSVTSIGYSAFFGCSRISSITIPNSVTSIGSTPFYRCSRLTSIDVDVTNTAYKSVDGILFSKDGTKLICCPADKSGDITIPNGVMYIVDYAFHGCTNLTSITIPSSVKSIWDGAISYCDRLSDVFFCGNAPSISLEVFKSCAADFTIHYLSTSTGYTNPWYGYPTAPITLDTPTNLTVTSAGYNSNKIVWTAVPEATGYAIYRSTSASSGFVKITTRSLTGYADTGLTTGTKYYYQVKAYTKVGTTTVFGDATATVGAAPIPAVPTGLTVTSAGYISDKISWTAVPGATGYAIYRSTSASSGFVKITTRSTTSYTDTGLTTGTKYYYKVKAYTTVGTKTTFGVAAAAVGAVPKPVTPTGLKAVRASATSIKLTWTSVTGATGYGIYRSKSPASGFASIATATSASYTNTGLTTGTKYYYQVKAYTTVGTTKVYSVITSAVNATP